LDELQAIERQIADIKSSLEGALGSSIDDDSKVQTLNTRLRFVDSPAGGREESVEGCQQLDACEKRKSIVGRNQSASPSGSSVSIV
jgi:hypothetical protein